MNNTLITFENVTLGYGKKIILRNISLDIFDGDYFGLVGPNGAGKTTIVRAILGTLKARSGKIQFGKKSDDSIRFGYVPQRDTIESILPYTVYDVIMMGRYKIIGLFRSPKKRDHTIVQECLADVGIENLQDHPFKELSGGQKQRTLIARALASKPDVLVLDEPTNGMDLSSRIAILHLIHALHDKSNLTVIMVSHLLDDVANFVKRIAFVDKNLFQVGNTDEILTEDNLSAMYQMPVQVIDVHGKKVIHAGGTNGNK